MPRARSGFARRDRRALNSALGDAVLALRSFRHFSPATDPAVALLATIPGVGPLTASALVTTIDDIARWQGRQRQRVPPSFRRSPGQEEGIGLVEVLDCAAMHALVRANDRARSQR